MKSGRRAQQSINRYALLTVFALLAVIIFFFYAKLTSDAHESIESYKYYTSVTIESGDTLWDIAGRYITDDYKNKDEYISEVCSINHIQPEDLIAGQCIVVPYYSTEYFN